MYYIQLRMNYAEKRIEYNDVMMINDSLFLYNMGYEKPHICSCHIIVRVTL